MNTCDTCKHWGTGSWGSNLDVSACGKLETEPAAHDIKPDSAYAVDKQGMAGFMTGPKFGCIHHEPE